LIFQGKARQGEARFGAAWKVGCAYHKRTTFLRYLSQRGVEKMRYTFTTTDRKEADLVFQAKNYYGAIYDILDLLRRYRKYDSSISDSDLDLVEKIESDVFDIIGENGVNNLF
jgi:hypothetical protein